MEIILATGAIMSGYMEISRNRRKVAETTSLQLRHHCWQEAQPFSEVDLASHVFGPRLFEVDERKAKELVDASQGIGHARDVAGGLREDLEVQHCGQGKGAAVSASSRSLGHRRAAEWAWGRGGVWWRVVVCAARRPVRVVHGLSVRVFLRLIYLILSSFLPVPVPPPALYLLRLASPNQGKYV